MFFTNYNPLTMEQVKKALSTSAAPKNKEEIRFLQGLSFTARLTGEYAPEELSYHFVDEEHLQVTENGTMYTVSYGAKSLGKMVLVSHQIPALEKQWHLIIDTETYAMTAFETWFGITVPVGGDLFGQKEPDYYRDIPREVQRQYYFGFADTGVNEKPAAFHTTTNRIEGRGLHWLYDTGYEILTFNPSVICTTVVELNSEMGGITMANPADYIRIDDEYYIYARWEVQFSGAMHLEILNFFDMKSAGLTLGFDEQDAFHYDFHTATIESTGVLAHMEKIADNGDKENPYLMAKKKKGARYAYRPSDLDVPMTNEEALKEAASARHIFEPEGNIMEAQYHMPVVDKLSGRKFSIVLDHEKFQAAPWNGTKGTVYEYEILSGTSLRWRVNDGEWIEDEYRAFEPDKDLFFFSHFLTGAEDYATVGQVVDFKTGLTTTVRTGIGNWRSGWETGANVFFGTLLYEGVKAPFTRRHHFTDELVGKSFAWAYGESSASIHMYSAPESYSWTIIQGNNSGGASWSAPGFYIKLREDVYLLQWIEENCNGNQGLLVINRKIQHDGGFFYGVNRGKGVKIAITGAYMRELGSLDIKKYFDRMS